MPQKVELQMIARAGDKEENYSDGESPLPAVSANTLARCLGVPPKVIYDLAKAGIIERGSSRLFELEDSVRRYCQHLRRQLGDRI
jgi:hypothetical protein